MELIIYFVAFLLFSSIGFFFGRRAERKHFAELERREVINNRVLATQTKHFMQPAAGGRPPALLMAETVVASDYMKSFLAKMKNIFGGEVKSFETLLERARREVTVQLQEQAAAQGYNAICNVRLNSASVGGTGPKAAAMASILGWATAYETALVQSGGPPSPQASPPGPDYNHLA